MHTSISKISVFSGTGALDDALPGQVLLTCDSYGPARDLLHHRYPRARVAQDVTSLHLSPETSVAGSIRVLTGGSPCQDLSVAGTGKGAAEGSGTRSALAWEMPRLALEAEAHVVVHENVPAARTRMYPYLEDRYQEHGYQTHVEDFTAAEVGAPHVRHRTLLVASRDPAAASWLLQFTPHVDVSGVTVPAARGRSVPTPTVVDRSWGLTRDDWESLRGHFRARGYTRGDGLYAFWRNALVLDPAANPALGDRGTLLTQWERVSGYQMPHPLGGLAGSDDKDPALHKAVLRMQEWSMGWEPGLVTGRGLSVSAQRRLIGNGVVPLAVRAALRRAVAALSNATNSLEEE